MINKANDRKATILIVLQGFRTASWVIVFRKETMGLWISRIAFVHISESFVRPASSPEFSIPSGASSSSLLLVADLPRASSDLSSDVSIGDSGSMVLSLRRSDLWQKK